MKTIAGRTGRSGVVLIAALLAGFAFSTVAKAAPGNLDLTFSGDGKQTTNFGPGFSQALAIVRQPDGKIVAVGAQRPRLRPRPLQLRRLARHELLRRRQADDRLRGPTAANGGGAPAGRQDRRGRARRRTGDFALARYNPNGSLDPTFSGDGKQTTDFGSAAATRRAGWRSRRTARSSRSARGYGRHRLRPRPLQPQRLARPELLRRRQADDRLRAATTGRTGWRSRGTARSSRSAPRQRRRRLRPRPLQPERLARHELLRRRQADDRLRRQLRRGERGGAPGRRQDRRGRHAGGADGDFALARYNPNGSLDTSFSGDGKQTTDFGGYATRRTGWRSRATARSSRSGRRRQRQRLRARPLQPQRLARHELLRRRQADDRLRGLRRGERGGAPGRRQDRRGRRAARRTATSRSPATTRTARSTRASPATASRRPTSAGFDEANGVAIQARRQDRRGRSPAPRRPTTTSRSPATTPTGRSTRASPATASRRPTSAGFDGRTGWRSRRDGKIVVVGRRWHRHDGDFALARYNPNGVARHELLRRRQADDRLRRRSTRGERRGAPGATARSSRSARDRPRRLRPRPLQPERLARHELLRRRQADDRLRGSDEANGVAIQARRQDRRGRRRRARPRRLRARPLQPQRLARHELLRRRQADDRLRRASTGANGVAIQADGKIVAVGGDAARRLRPRPLQPQRLARHELLRRRQADDRLRGGSDEASGVALQANGKIVAVGSGGAPATRLRARPLQPQRLARHELLRRRHPDDRLRRASDGANGVALQGDGKIVAVGSGLGTD